MRDVSVLYSSFEPATETDLSMFEIDTLAGEIKCAVETSNKHVELIFYFSNPMRLQILIEHTFSKHSSFPNFQLKILGISDFRR